MEAIEKLKEKMAKGEPLEKTQIMKIETETQLKAEIKGLGASL